MNDFEIPLHFDNNPRPQRTRFQKIRSAVVLGALVVIAAKIMTPLFDSDEEE